MGCIVMQYVDIPVVEGYYKRFGVLVVGNSANPHIAQPVAFRQCVQCKILLVIVEKSFWCGGIDAIRRVHNMAYACVRKIRSPLTYALRLCAKSYEQAYRQKQYVA